MKEDAGTLTMITDHYRMLWQVLEDLETLLWRIKGLNEDLENCEAKEE